MLELNYTWTHDGTSGGLDGVYIAAGALESALYVQHSTLASTQSFSLQTAQQSSGPWFTEASTSISTGAVGQVVLRMTGPYLWVRPFFHSESTGTYTIRLLAKS
jgi:hypothetical protein